FQLLRVYLFFNDPATTEIYTLSLHDALPICWRSRSAELAGLSALPLFVVGLFCPVEMSMSESAPLSAQSASSAHPTRGQGTTVFESAGGWNTTCQNSKSDRKSTRLNSSHVKISYAVFCLK